MVTTDQQLFLVYIGFMMRKINFDNIDYIKLIYIKIDLKIK
jgi:hypothetical protein